MKSLKIFSILAIALLSFGSADAQTSSKKKTKTKTTKEMVKYDCPMKCEGDKTYKKAGKCPVCGMALTKAKKETVAYKCPMQCEGNKTYAKEGKCPVCNMKLAKLNSKKATDGHEGHNHK